MLGRNFASTTASIAKSNLPTIEAVNQPNYLDMLKNTYDDYLKYDKIRTDKANRQALTDALRGGDEEAIQKAYAVANPDAYMDYLNKVKLARETADTDFANKKELLGLENKYNIALQNLKNEGLANKQSGADLTSASKNYEYLKAQGLDDNQAMAIAFGGNTEAVGSALASGSLGAKGMEQLQKDIAKQIAKDKEALSGISVGLKNLDSLQKTIEEKPEVVGFQTGITTGLKRAESLLGSQEAKEFLKNRGYAYRQVGNIKNDLIAKAKQAGQSGINTATEIEQATAGISEKSSPEELLGAINAMRQAMNNLQIELANKNKAQEAQPTMKDSISSKYQGIVWGK